MVQTERREDSAMVWFRVPTCECSGVVAAPNAAGKCNNGASDAFHLGGSLALAARGIKCTLNTRNMYE